MMGTLFNRLKIAIVIVTYFPDSLFKKKKSAKQFDIDKAFKYSEVMMLKARYVTTLTDTEDFNSPRISGGKIWKGSIHNFN